MAPTNPPKNSAPATKRLVRNFEVPLPRNGANIRYQSTETGEAHQVANDKYRKPQLLSTLQLKQQMQRVRIAEVPRSRNVKDLTPKALELVQEKV